MKTSTKKTFHRKRRSARTRAKLFGTAECPRLSVFRSNNHVYAQLINDEAGKTIAASFDMAVSEKKKTRTERAEAVGSDIAKQAKKKKINTVIFDRGPYSYTGVVKVLAESARKEGLSF